VRLPRLAAAQGTSALLFLFDYAHLFHILEKLPGLDPDFGWIYVLNDVFFNQLWG
jgi:hypothetical protein